MRGLRPANEGRLSNGEFATEGVAEEGREGKERDREGKEREKQRSTVGSVRACCLRGAWTRDTQDLALELPIQPINAVSLFLSLSFTLGLNHPPAPR